MGDGQGLIVSETFPVVPTWRMNSLYSFESVSGRDGSKVAIFFEVSLLDRPAQSTREWM